MENQEVDYGECIVCGRELTKYDQVNRCENCWEDYDSQGKKIIRYLNVYEVTSRYGGPEEGGWWYNQSDPITNIYIYDLAEEDVQTLEGILLKAYANVNQGNINSVRGGSELDIRRESRRGKFTPKPRYE